MKSLEYVKKIMLSSDSEAEAHYKESKMETNTNFHKKLMVIYLFMRKMVQDGVYSGNYHFNVFKDPQTREDTYIFKKMNRRLCILYNGVGEEQFSRHSLPAPNDVPRFPFLQFEDAKIELNIFFNAPPQENYGFYVRRE